MQGTKNDTFIPVSALAVKDPWSSMRMITNPENSMSLSTSLILPW